MPGKQWLRKVSFAAVVITSTTLLIMDKADNWVAQGTRNSVANVVTPVLSVVARPFDAVANVGAWFHDVLEVHSENIALKNQNLELLHWQSMAHEMEAENHSLRELLKVVPQQKYTYITARIVSDFGGPYVRSALLNGGKDQGLQIDQPVLSETGVLGRVVSVADNNARVLLLSDINSRVPVMIESGSDRGILAGRDEELPQMIYLAPTHHIHVGDRVVTSGDGGVFPPNLPVGVVSSVDGSQVHVQPFADVSGAEFVSIIDYTTFKK